jgi:VIT1/CCC1 family predicted Fe2+/Mn2+ transporter
MPQTHHVERHFGGNHTIRDIVIGMSDGLTVPFALAAGLAGSIASTAVIVTAGLAEIAAGSIAMGLGGFLAARSDAEHYASEERRERREVADKPLEEEAEVADVLARYGLTRQEVKPLVAALKRHPKAWVDFMMRFELNLERPEPSQAVWSALTIAGSYIFGGLIPLAPYFFLRRPEHALTVSVAVTLFALTAFGFVKGYFTGVHPVRSGLQTMVVGGVAAGVAFAIARAVAHA